MSLLSGLVETIILVGHAWRVVVSKRHVFNCLSFLRRGAGEAGGSDCAADSPSGGELRSLFHVDTMVRRRPDSLRGSELPVGPMAAPRAYCRAAVGWDPSELAAAWGV